MLFVPFGKINHNTLVYFLLNFMKAIKQVLELDLTEKTGEFIKVKASARLVTCEDESRIEDNDFQSYT